MNGLDQSIRFCNSPENSRIAYVQTGEGLPILKTGNWLCNLSTDFENFIWKHLFAEFSKSNKLIAYDLRGCGLSGKESNDFSLDAQIKDAEIIADELNLEKFVLLGVSSGAASAVAFAARHPEKVSRLILLGGAVNYGASSNFNQPEKLKIESFLQSVKKFWGNASSQSEIAPQFFSGLNAEKIFECGEVQRNSCSAETAHQLLKTFVETDLTEIAKLVKCPTLIFHSLNDEFIPFSQSGLFSALIPDSKLILLDSGNHLLLEHEPAWQEFVSETHTFLAENTPLNSFGQNESVIDLQATIPMEDARWEQVGELFSEAMKLPGDKRLEILDKLEEGNSDLRREVEALIENAENRSAAPIGFLTRVPFQSEDEIYENQIISRYKILEKLGAGGMGVVFRALDLSLEREVALKFLPRKYNANPAMKHRFTREARAAAALDHPNIAGVFEVGETDGGRLYIAMPFYRGETLKQKIFDGSVTVKDAVEYAIQIAEGLSQAHRAGIIHRDIKPENIMITDSGGLKILDFGVAKIADADVTQKGILLGTISYMSPEQAAGEIVDQRSDLWSLGLVLYESLTGRQPFKTEEISTMISTILLREPVPVSQIAENIPPELEQIVFRALKKTKTERYQNARDFADDLKKIKPIVSGEVNINKPEYNYEKFAPLDDTSLTPNNLSNQLTPLVGRGREILEIKNLLNQTDVRLVTLTGIGGTGKTRLSHKIAREMLAAFPDGVFFIDLSAIFKSELVAPEIARVLKIKESGSELIENILKNFLAGKKMLLILDNFEQIVEAAPGVAELLASAPELKILVTSRNILQIRGEHEYKVSPLALPDSDSFHSENSLAEYASITLFLQRAKAAKGEFELTGDNIQNIVEICKKLDGLPLAIELAAARIKILSTKDLLARLDNQLGVLTGGAKDLPVRQQTMKNAIEWSYDLLDETERKFFRRFSVFVGGASFDAIEQVCYDDYFDALEIVGSLSDKSLIRVKEQTDGEKRFLMLEVVRQFSERKLIESSENEEAKKFHAEYFLELALSFEPKLRGAEQALWLDKLETEHGNLRVTFEYFLKSDVEKCLELTGAMHRLWSVHGHYTEGRKLIEQVLDKSRNASKSARTKALIPAADLAWSQGDLESAARFYEECLILSRETGDQRKIAQSCNGLAITRLNQNIFDIRPMLEESLRIGRELADKPIIGVALMGLGELSRLEGNNEEAKLFYEEIVDEARKGGDAFNLLYGLFNLGSVSCMNGDAEKARSQFTESISIAQKLGSVRAVADCLDGFGYVAAITGDAAKAAKLFGAADALRETVGFEIQTADRIFRDHFIEKAKDLIGENSFAEFEKLGKMISPEGAVELAFENSL